MKWSEVFLGAAWVVANRTTLLVVLGWTAVSGFGVVALLRIAADAGIVGGPTFVVIALLWIFFTQLFMRATVAIVASSDRSLSFGDAISRCFSYFGSYIGSSLILVGVSTAAALIILGVAQLGRTGVGGVLLLALLTPFLVLVGAGTILLLSTGQKLAFAAVSVDGARSGEAVGSVAKLMRDHRGETLLWVAVNAALLVGLFVAIVVPIFLATAAVNSVELASLVRIELLFKSKSEISGSVNAVRFGLVVEYIFLWAVLGVWLSFSTASAVYFRRALLGRPMGGVGPMNPRLPSSTGGRPEGGFCDRCGVLAPAGTRFCDSCGAPAYVP